MKPNSLALALLFGATTLTALTYATPAHATCSRTCQGELVDSMCAPYPIASNGVVYLPQFFNNVNPAVSCTVQCCVPGECSEPTPDPVSISSLSLTTTDGNLVEGASFSLHESMSCLGKELVTFTHPNAYMHVGQTLQIVSDGMILTSFYLKEDASLQDDVQWEDMASTSDMASASDMSPTPPMEQESPAEEPGGGCSPPLARAHNVVYT